MQNKNHIQIRIDQLSISIRDLSFIIGKWNGLGHAEYPTIQPIDYSEELVFTINKKDAVIHMEQRTWIKSSDHTNDEPIFWESGFLIDRDNGVFELAVAQKSGRVEILRCNARRIGDEAFEFPFESTSIVNDSRMIRSGRIYTISKNVLEYELKMSTASNTSYKRHLKCRLTKSDN